MGYGTLIQRITYKISGRSAASSGLYTPSTNQYDYALGGVPFLSGSGDERVDTERPVEQRKQQFDSFKDPGEYSLNQWWLRSQTSFIGGEGIIFQDPDTQGTAKNIRYSHGLGVDPFSDPDLLSLLRRTEQATALGNASFGTPYVASQVRTADERFYVAKGDLVETREITANNLTILSTATIPASGATQVIEGGVVAFQDTTTLPPEEFCTVFMQDFSSAANTGIWRVDSGSAVSTKLYNSPTNINGITLGKGRGFLLVGNVNELVVLDPYVTVTTAWPAASAVVPKDQEIVAITDGPDAVYVAANSENQGYIYKTTFNSSGLINGLTLTAILPNGEKINDCQAYLNTFMVISTTSSIRVGTFTGDGIVYGPQLLTVDVTEPNFGASITGSGFGRIAFYGNKAYICTLGDPQHDDMRGVMAVDLSVLQSDSNTGSTFNAYCTWTYFDNNTFSLEDIAVSEKGRVVFTAGINTDAAIYVEHESTLVESGYLETGRCRFNTIEPKLFKYASIRTPTPLQGEITVTLLDDTGGETNYITYGPTLDPGVDDIATPTPGGPRNWEAFRFTLRRGADPAFGGVLDSWQIKALPGTLKQRLITRHFLCFNHEEDKTGQRISGDTLSLDRLTAVRQMCQRGDTVTFQDLAQNIATQVVIDDYQFAMPAKPGPNKENYGGYLTVVMRTVADAVPMTAPVMVEGD